ncbi:DUF397 domain-containing protein [Nocardia sp. CDC159]|uniref:DUF397 domain-containing protein n=1 Tax=Nocardia pulmonis TaxID=2951408 RepID=A0A9X2E8F9_9NOCA|nr:MULTISPECIES: DUF397 domain-containing protein [Nocardia]MCM6774810.1 DUF397 domain-containing protein [Nocardia pulmonis]MCM6789741.1 DUF397 domain-containing protein [Nocardia sp. CDC159]
MSDLSGVRWFKSSYSGGNTECVEIAWLEDSQIGVRDSKHPSGPALIFTPAEWDAFTTNLRNDMFSV